jgi:hypothetical protein
MKIDMFCILNWTSNSTFQYTILDNNQPSVLSDRDFKRDDGNDLQMKMEFPEHEGGCQCQDSEEERI